MNDSRRLMLAGGLGLLAMVSVACSGEPATAPPPQEPAASPPAPATAAPLAETPVQPALPHPSWVEVRDARFGYAVAVPCWWWVIPTPPEGSIASMTLHSYDEAYFAQNSTRGVWNGGDYPEGAFKMDLTAMADQDTYAGTLELVRPLLDSDIQEIVATENTTVGRHSALRVNVRSRLNPEESSRLTIFRLTPDRLLMVSAFPQGADDSPDVQGILESIAFTPDEAVALPSHPPSAPLIGLPAGCVGP